MSIPTGYYTDVTKNYCGIDPASTNQEEVETAALLWSEFLSKVPAEESPYFYVIGGTDESKIKDSILSIISSYISSSGLSQEEIDLYSADLAHELAVRRNTPELANLMSTDPAQVSALFSSLLSPYVHTLPGIFVALAEEIALMNADQQKQKMYLDFLSQKLQSTYESEAINSLSPTEVQNRFITYTLFEILLTLINLASKTQTLASTAVEFLVEKEQNYVELLKNTFMYVGKGQLLSDFSSTMAVIGGTPSSEDWWFTKTAPSSDPTLFDLGYGNITLQNIFDYLAKNTVTLTKPEQDPATPDVPPPDFASTSFTLKSGIYADPGGSGNYRSSCELKVTKNFADNTFKIESTFKLMNGSTVVWGPVNSQQTFPFSIVVQEPLQFRKTITDSLSQTFYETYNQAKAAGVVEVPEDSFAGLSDEKKELAVRSRNLMIPWGAYKGDTTVGALIGPARTGWYEADNTVKYSDASGGRTSQNKTINTYIQNIKSKKDLVSDIKDSQSQVVDAGISSRKQQINLIQGLINQLKNIISSIYK